MVATTTAIVVVGCWRSCALLLQGGGCVGAAEPARQPARQADGGAA
eukprot:COSAG01_NODE_66920_length_268_cov_1.218935_1_plen_45_part_10